MSVPPTIPGAAPIGSSSKPRKTPTGKRGSRHSAELDGLPGPTPPEQWPQPSPPPAPPTLEQLAGTVAELRTRLAKVEAVTRQNCEQLTALSADVQRIPELLADVQAMQGLRAERRRKK